MIYLNSLKFKEYFYQFLFWKFFENELKSFCILIDMFDLILLVVYIINFPIFFILHFYSNKFKNESIYFKSELSINWIIINSTNHANVFQVSIKSNKLCLPYHQRLLVDSHMYNIYKIFCYYVVLNKNILGTSLFLENNKKSIS